MKKMWMQNLQWKWTQESQKEAQCVEAFYGTCTTDKLGKHAYEHQELFYKYNAVLISLLGMVDDILAATDVENTFIEEEEKIVKR